MQNLRTAEIYARPPPSPGTLTGHFWSATPEEIVTLMSLRNFDRRDHSSFPPSGKLTFGTLILKEPFGSVQKLLHAKIGNVCPHPSSTYIALPNIGSVRLRKTPKNK